METIRLINSNVRYYIIADGFYYAGYSVVNAFLSILITSQVSGGQLDMVGYAISYYMLIRSLTEIPISHLTNKLNLKTKINIIAYSYIIYGIIIFFLGYSSQMWHIFLAQTILAILDAIAYPIKWTIFTKIVDEEHEELEWGLEDMGSTLLPAIFTSVAGLVSSWFGLQYAFILFAILIAGSGFIFFYIEEKI